ncbi:metal-dependent hydrolase [Priestia iocasae]|uniref:Inner membrane protein n=1 Tax=Priestia iocasae TaxID=2291674 RepID=A0ABS2QYP3_9BACI|nr:inner membrane protein [Metabacillus iocasae]
MDTITHTLFGLGIYGAINKEHLSKKEKRVLLFTTIGASQIPDIDVISQLWDTDGRYQMWHRGITHSIFLTPIWALLFYLISWLLFAFKSKTIFFTALIAVIIHNTSDVFNAWGTGYLEPFSTARLTFGTIPIIDFVIWFVFIMVFLLSRKKKEQRVKIYRVGWALIALHIFLQSAQGYMLYHKYDQSYEQVALSASFVPWNFSVIAKSGNQVSIIDETIFTEGRIKEVLTSSDDANLDQLFSKNPRAKTLYEWAPFVVVVEDDQTYGIYDPRFYRNGQSFLFEYMENGKIDR